MPRRIHLEPHLSADELERRYRGAREPHERSWFQMLWLLAKGQTATTIAESTGYSRYWIGQVARRYNQEGPAGMQNRRSTHSHRAQPLLSSEHLAELAEAVRGPVPEGEHWIGRTVAAWMRAKPGRPVSVYLGWAYLVRLMANAVVPGHAMCRRTPRRSTPSKKAEAAAVCGRDRVPPGADRAVGRRRTPHRLEADPA